MVRLQRKLAMLEHLESLAVLEQAVWKNKLVEGNDPTAAELAEGFLGGQRKRIKADSLWTSEADFRQACRAVCGAGVVISRVLPFFEHWRSA